MSSFWIMLPLGVKLLVLLWIAIALPAMSRSLRLARQLYTGRGFTLETITKEPLAPDLLAQSALASRAPVELMIEGRLNLGELVEEPNRGRVLKMLRMADERFWYLLEKTSSDALSIKQSSVITFLLVAVTIAYGALPTYSLFYNDTNRTGLASLLFTIDELLKVLTLGLSLGTVLYVVSCLFERAIRSRVISWKYLYATLRNELSATDGI